MFEHYFVKNVVSGNIDISDKDIYSFGVYSGSTMVSLQQVMAQRNLKPRKHWGFDSFEGLPVEDGSVARYKKHNVGEFSSKAFFNTDNVDAIIHSIKKKLIYPQITEFVVGYYKDTLIDELAKNKQMRPAGLIEVDVDLYVSTIELMDFMCRNGLVEVGTMIYYDDWGGVKEYTGGESLAHMEICELHGMKCEVVFEHGDGNPHKKMMFQVVSI